MDLKSLSTILTTDDVLEKFSQEIIMEFYFEDTVRIGRFYCNPFRNDKTPGCRFFYTKSGVLVFNDFSTNKQSNCFQMASFRAGRYVTPTEVFNQLSGISPKKLPRPVAKFVDEADRQSQTTISVKIMPYNESDLKYWMQFNISIDILKKFNVRKVEKAWINGIIKYIDLKTDPCYRYLEQDRIKLYRPYSKRSKFRNNYTQELEGMSQLPDNGDKLIITKSMKDIMMFYSLGLPAVCPRSETSLISEEGMLNLFARFKEVFIWFDSDPTGVERSIILYEKYKEQGLIRLTHSDQLAKDTSDIVKVHGLDKLIELCVQCEIL